MTTEEQFGKGGYRDKVDVRDEPFLAMASIPFDWENGYDEEEELRKILKQEGFRLPVKDQNGSFSCGGQGWATYSSVLEAIATETFEERSAKYIYAQTYVGNGGSYGRDNCKVCVKQGVALESKLTSYDNGNAPAEPFMQRSQDVTLEARIDAKNAKHLRYKLVSANIEHVAQAIRDNNGVVLGITGQNNGTWLSEFPKPPKAGGGPEWRHWVYAGKAKLINGKKHIGILNSWGEKTGQKGWQWISEDYFRVKVSDGLAVWNSWTMVFDENPRDVSNEEKKGDILSALKGAFTRLAELLRQLMIESGVARYFGIEKAKTAGYKRSSHWRRVRKTHIKLYPICEVCGRNYDLDVHHCVPFNVDRTLELEPSNLITLCSDHHLFIGHLMNYRSYNKGVKMDAIQWRGRITNRP